MWYAHPLLEPTNGETEEDIGTLRRGEKKLNRKTSQGNMSWKCSGSVVSKLALAIAEQEC